MKCSQMRLSDRRYKPPPRVSKCESGPIIRPCIQRFALNELPARYSSSRSYRSTSPQTTSSDPSSTDSQKIPLIICNLNIAPDVKTLAPKNVKKSAKKLPPFCVQYQNSLSKNGAVQESNMKTINDFIVQGKLIANHRRRVRQKSHAHQDSPDIIVNCGDDECDECISDIALNVFNNINTDLLLSLDCYEMDSFGRLPGDSRTPTPIPIGTSSSNLAASTSGISNAPTPTLLTVPAGYRPLSLRTPSPNTRSIIRIDLVNRDKIKTEPNIKDINYNMNRLKEKRGVREKDQKSDKLS